MPKKIPFQVVYATGEETSHPVTELNTHGPGVRGWRSAPDTIYPQEVVLRMRYPATVTRIQVLAHQYLIPERLELWLHHQQTSEPKTPSSQEYEYLGFVSLADNMSTNFTSRELQSVSVAPRLGTHLKLRLSKNYSNNLNIHNQVALIAINILGDDIGDPLNLGNNLPDGWGPGDNDYTSQCDDLAFSMYVEAGVADIIREMEIKKHQAVKAERFEYARRLKSTMGTLRVAGERLGRYELAKRVAVLEEDYQKATLRKEQIEIYRAMVYESVNVKTLLEIDGPDTANDECVDPNEPNTSASLPNPPNLQEVADHMNSLPSTSLQTPPTPKSKQPQSLGKATNIKVQDQPQETKDEPVLQTNIIKPPEVNTSPIPCGPGRSPNRGSPTACLSHTGSLRRRNKSAPRSSYEDYEERAVPALRHSHTNEFLRECQSTNVEQTSAENRGRSRLSERERRQAALAILVFGNDLVELFYSKQFSDREEGLNRLRSCLREGSGGNRQARGASLLLHRSIRDPVFSVYSSAAETIRTLFVEFVPNRVSASEVARAVDRLLPELLARSGDTSARINTLAQHTILSIAACEEVKNQHLVAPALGRPVGNGTHPRLALSRLLMLEQVILSQGISQDKQSGLTCRTLSECGFSGLHHPAEPVRKVAERVLIQVYKINPRLVRKQLPPDDDITRRNLLYRQLFQEFDKIDIQRKKEIIERNKILQQNSISSEYGPHYGDDVKRSPETNYKHPKQMEKSVKYSLQLNNYQRTEPKSSLKPKKEMFTNEQNYTENYNNEHKLIYKTKSCIQQNGSPRHAPTEDGKFDTIKKSKSGQYLRGDYDYDNTVEKLTETFQNGDLLGTGDSSAKSSHSVSPMPDGTIIHCSFCGWGGLGVSWTQLDRHYWRHCPMLTQCSHCQQVVEISTLTQHLIVECDSKHEFKQCDRCLAAVHIQLYTQHLEEHSCRVPVDGIEKCPLCHSDVLENNWDDHLKMHGCPSNLRRRPSKN